MSLSSVVNTKSLLEDTVFGGISSAIWDKYPNEHNLLLRMNDVDNTIDEMARKKLRTGAFMDSIPKKLLKILRITINHQYVVAAGNDKGYFLITLEGTVLDHNLYYTTPFGRFFDKIIFQIDKKYNNQYIEWNCKDHPNGSKANFFRLKLIGDKPPHIKILLYRAGVVYSTPSVPLSSNNTNMTASGAISSSMPPPVNASYPGGSIPKEEKLNSMYKRYNITPQLRVILPNIQADPTEEDIMLGLNEYIKVNNLLDVSNNRLTLVKIDNNLSQLLLAAAGTTTTLLLLKQKIFLNHVISAAPIQIEYQAATNNSYKNGKSGKIVDIEVDLADYHSLALIQHYNILNAERADANEYYYDRLLKMKLLVNKMNSVQANIETLEYYASASFSNPFEHSLPSNQVCIMKTPKNLLHMVHNKPYISLEYSLTDAMDRISDAGSVIEHRSLSSEEQAPLEYISKFSEENYHLKVPSQPSAIHMCKGYIDIDDDNLFQGSRGAKWLNLSVSTALNKTEEPSQREM